MARKEKKPKRGKAANTQAGSISQQPLNQGQAYQATPLSAKQQKKEEKHAKFIEKLDMYDMILANLLAGKSIIEPSEHLDNSQIAIGFSNIASETQISKYFMVRQFPDYLQPCLIDIIRSRCINNGVKINFFFYGNPYRINWDSAEMRNKMTIWKQYADDHSGPIDVFDYRTQRSGELARRRIITSTKYLNEAELDYRRTLIRTCIIIEVSARRDPDSIINMMNSIKALKDFSNQSDIKLRELQINMIDWLRVFGTFCLRTLKEVTGKSSYKIFTDDILANFNSYKQGRVGDTGVSLGIDVLSGVPVMRKFKADPDAAENWLISAETGGGKSYYVKALLTYLLADNFVVTVMDYEGDEYINLANYIRAGKASDVKVISMGKGSTTYFDPCEIPELTGDPDVDDDLKESAVSYILSMFRIITCGLDGDLTQWEERIISTAIMRMYDSAGVTDNKETWFRSKGLRLSDVYYEIKQMVESKELVDSEADNIKHKSALRIADAASIYFEEGEAKAGTFKNPMSANDLYDAKFIIFSFGMKGAADNLNDPTILALKQLSVACVSIQISNYCKYVRHCFNVKVWEEFQRWQSLEGSDSIVSNAMTGGRKRGDVNFIITNDLASMIDEDNALSKKLRQNIQNMAIGRIKDRGVREDFCRMFDLQDCRLALDRIAKAHVADDGKKGLNSGTGSRYRHSFCVVLDSGKKAIAKVMLPQSIAQSSLFRTGVDVGLNKSKND